MQEPANLPRDIGVPGMPLVPDQLPPTLQRRRKSSPDLPTQEVASLPISSPIIATPLMPDEGQPSAQIRALRRDSMATATAIISVAFIISRLVGVLRVSLFAAAFGNGSIADAYNFAFNLPDTVYNIVAGGALSSAFIPIFTDYLIERRDRKTAWYITSASFNIFTVLLIALAGIAALFAPQLGHLYAPGVFGATSPDKRHEADLIVMLTRIMLLQPILLGVSVITTGVLQSRQRFLLPAIGSILYNVGLIGGIIVSIVDAHTGVFGGHLGIYGPTWGVVVAALLQLVVQLPGLVTAKMTYSFTFNIFHPGVRRIFVLMGPRIINSIALYASNFVILALLSYQNQGAVYGYKNAFILILLPIGIFGMALSQAAFPTLAALISSREWDRMRSTVLSTVRLVLYLAIPSALGMMVFAEPLTRLILVHGAFNADREILTYGPLIYFAIGIPGLALIEILVRAYYAIQDVRTTVEISILQFLFVIGLSVVLTNTTNLGADALALATSLGATGEAIVLLLILRSRLGGFKIRPLFNFTVGVLAASLVATLAALLTFTLLEVAATAFFANIVSSLINTTILAVELIVSAMVGAVVYYLGARFLGIEGTLPVDRLAKRVFGRFRR